MYLADGSPYTAAYAPLPPAVRAVAIGWLDPAHPYSAGDVDDELVTRLFEACRAHATARTRGFHRCGFCPAGAVSEIGATTFTRDGETLALGDAELRLVAADSTWLIAPTLVLHYVATHRYRPPTAFVEAVCSGLFAPS